MMYRGPHKIRVEEKDAPPIEHPDDAIVRMSVAAICGSDLPVRTLLRTIECCTRGPTVLMSDPGGDQTGD
jgi:threonine dehydrogenase-like Zn-dependent dehydrogenase